MLQILIKCVFETCVLTACYPKCVLFKMTEVTEEVLAL